MMLSPLGILGVLLGVSIAGNAILTNAYLGQRDATIAASDRAATSHAAAQACSEGVARVREAAEAQRVATAAAVATAQQEAREAQRRALAWASKPATRPGDDCGSAQDRINAWMQHRRPVR